MDDLEWRLVFERIQRLDPVNVYKIIGHLLLKGYGKVEMIRLASWSDVMIRDLIHRVKQELSSSLNPAPQENRLADIAKSFAPFKPSSSRPPSFSEALPAVAYLGDQMGSVQICRKFIQGYCNYGGYCKFIHVLGMNSGHVIVLNPPRTEESSKLDHECLKKLEMELVELLKSRRGIPVPIASLPILYYDKYRMKLHVEGYLGQAQCSLPQVLAEMTKSISVIDRPRGRQSIILVDDIYRYKRFIRDGNVDKSSAAISCQVYLTFPPHSTFSEIDVRNYFDKFGPVKEVRIPVQEKRMFGFVTFVFPETAALVLSKANPHFVCKSQLLVKPYQLKTELVDRKTEETVEQPTNSSPHFPDAEPELPSMPKQCKNVNLVPNELVREQEQSVELKTKRISELDWHNHTFVSQTSDGSIPPQGVPRNCSTSYNDIESFEEVNLPDSPFDFDGAEF